MSINSQEPKYFDLELYNNFLRKITHNKTKQNLYIFKYKDKNKIGELIKHESPGIYFISKKVILNDIYIGQTTKGISRFNKNHNFLTKNEIDKEYNIFFFKLDEEYINKSILDYIEKEIIKNIANNKNGNKGNNVHLNNKDKEYANKIINSIYDLSEVCYLDLNVEGEKFETKIEDNISKISIRESKDLLKCAIEFIKSNGGKASKEDINNHVISKFKNDLNDGRWDSEKNLTQALSRDMQEVTKGYKISSENNIILEKISDPLSYKLIKK